MLVPPEHEVKEIRDERCRYVVGSTMFCSAKEEGKKGGKGENGVKRRKERKGGKGENGVREGREGRERG